MKAASHAESKASTQSGRGGAGVRTPNRLDAPLEEPAKKNKTQRSSSALFQPAKRQKEYQGAYRAVTADRPGTSMPILIGSGMIAAAILLSTLVTAVGTRFVGMESPNDENMWLVDRLTGSVYKCQASERGKASCAEIATGSIGEREKR